MGLVNCMDYLLLLIVYYTFCFVVYYRNSVDGVNSSLVYIVIVQRISIHDKPIRTPFCCCTSIPPYIPLPSNPLW